MDRIHITLFLILSISLFSCNNKNIGKVADNEDIKG